MAGNVKAIPTSDYDAVAATVQRYIDGMRKGSSQFMSTAFHRDATMYGFVGKNLFSGPIQNLYNVVDQGGEAPNLKARLDILDITQTTAVVRVDMEQDAFNTSYTDFHSLLKEGGEWKILHKVFHSVSPWYWVMTFWGSMDLVLS